MEPKRKLTLVTLLFLIVLFSLGAKSQHENINGVNFVGTREKITHDFILPLKSIHASWISLVPYAFNREGETTIRYNQNGQWWGETESGILSMIDSVRKDGLKVMIKPHVWVSGKGNRKDGWAGNINFDSETDKLKWLNSYKNYILFYARIAEKKRVELFCIGTELVWSTSLHTFWTQLISEVKEVYKGRLTYAANWDNYKNIKFWDKLDYIGIDAYFPLSQIKTPRMPDLLKPWISIKKEIENTHKRYNRPILFTEYGYRSVNFTAGKQWEIKDDWKYNNQANEIAQANAYLALYKTFWTEPWMSGGFIWKWYADLNSGGENNTDYTPQNKAVLSTIKRYYE